VPPAWRDAERRIHDAFHPTIDALAVTGATRALAEQVLSSPPAGPARTRNEPPTVAAGGSDDRARQQQIDLTDQVEAIHQAARRPLHWRTVEVEVRLDSDGGLESAHVSLPSESPRLDEAALAAVQEELARRPIAKTDGMQVARFRISAARTVTPLDVSPVVAPGPRRRVSGIVPKVRIQFDEVSGKASVEKPFTQELHTEVKLLSLQPH
jgi:TonB family protein